MSSSATIDAVQPGKQHLEALQRANRVRLARAELKRHVAAQRLSAAEVILCSPPETETMEISELLRSQKRWGRERCRRLLMPLTIPENKAIGTLTARQRGILADALGSPPVPGDEPATFEMEARTGPLAALSPV